MGGTPLPTAQSIPFFLNRLWRRVIFVFYHLLVEVDETKSTVIWYIVICVDGCILCHPRLSWL